MSTLVIDGKTNQEFLAKTGDSNPIHQDGFMRSQGIRNPIVPLMLSLQEILAHHDAMHIVVPTMQHPVFVNVPVEVSGSAKEDQTLEIRLGENKPILVSTEQGPHQPNGVEPAFVQEYPLPEPVRSLSNVRAKYLAMTRVSNLLLDRVENLPSLRQIFRSGYAPVYKKMEFGFHSAADKMDQGSSLAVHLFESEMKFLPRLISYTASFRGAAFQHNAPIYDFSVELTLVPSSLLLQGLLSQQGVQPGIEHMQHQDQEILIKKGVPKSKTMILIGGAGAVGYASLQEFMHDYNLLVVDKIVPYLPEDVHGCFVKMDMGAPDAASRLRLVVEGMHDLGLFPSKRVDVINYALAFTRHLGFPGENASRDQVEEAKQISFYPIFSLHDAFANGSSPKVVAYSALTDMFRQDKFDGLFAIYGAMQQCKEELEREFAKRGPQFKLVKAGAFFSPSFFGILLNACKKSTKRDASECIGLLQNGERELYGNSRMTQPSDLASAARLLINNSHNFVQVVGDVATTPLTKSYCP